MNENPYTEGRRRADYSTHRNSAPKRPSDVLNCHFCGNKWDCKNRCFVCPKCHTTYNPTKSPAVGFGGEVKVARQRENMTQKELAEKIGCVWRTILNIEKGKFDDSRPKGGSNTVKGKIIREKLRIWVESTRSPIERRKEIDDMFNFDEKEKENG